MRYTELDLAQVEMRMLANERCISRQREVLKRQVDSGLPTDEALQRLAEFEARLLALRNERNRIRSEMLAANSKHLLEMLGLLDAPAAVETRSSRSQHRDNAVDA